MTIPSLKQTFLRKRLWQKSNLHALGDQMSKTKYLLESHKRRLKVHQKNMSREHGLNFEQ